MHRIQCVRTGLYYHPGSGRRHTRWVDLAYAWGYRSRESADAAAAVLTLAGTDCRVLHA